MGSLYSKLCSKPSTHEGGHTVLNNNTLGGEADSDGPNNPSDLRAARVKAAEQRRKAEEERGSILPGGGKLATQLKAQKLKPLFEPQAPEEPTPVWD